MATSHRSFPPKVERAKLTVTGETGHREAPKRRREEVLGYGWLRYLIMMHMSWIARSEELAEVSTTMMKESMSLI